MNCVPAAWDVGPFHAYVLLSLCSVMPPVAAFQYFMQCGVHLFTAANWLPVAPPRSVMQFPIGQAQP